MVQTTRSTERCRTRQLTPHLGANGRWEDGEDREEGGEGRGKRAEVVVFDR